MTQEICDKVADDFLPAWKFVPDWFVTSNMIEKFYTALYVDDGLLFFDEDSGNATFCCNEMGILRVNSNNINLDYTNDEEDDPDDPDAIILARLLAWDSKFEKHRAVKWVLNEELMPLVWHAKRWWNFCMSEDEKKKKNRTNFYWVMLLVRISISKHENYSIKNICVYSSKSKIKTKNILRCKSNIVYSQVL